MSHIVTIQTQVRDSIAVHAACRRLQWQPPLQGSPGSSAVKFKG